MNTASKALTLATISRRSASLKTGLRPFLAKLSLSEDTPTTSRSPRAADRFSTRTCPTWKTSNVPNVITVLPATSNSFSAPGLSRQPYGLSRQALETESPSHAADLRCHRRLHLQVIRQRGQRQLASDAFRAARGPIPGSPPPDPRVR